MIKNKKLYIIIFAVIVIITQQLILPGCINSEYDEYSSILKEKFTAHNKLNNQIMKFSEAYFGENLIGVTFSSLFKKFTDLKNKKVSFFAAVEIKKADGIEDYKSKIETFFQNYFPNNNYLFEYRFDIENEK